MPNTFHFDAVSGTVHCTRVGLEFNVDVRNASGATVAVVRLSETKLRMLMNQAEYELNAR